MKTSYYNILLQEINKTNDTDICIIKAYWATVKRLVELKDKKECQKFLYDFAKAFGQFKADEAKGDFIDAGILK